MSTKRKKSVRSVEIQTVTNAHVIEPRVRSKQLSKALSIPEAPFRLYFLRNTDYKNGHKPKQATLTNAFEGTSLPAFALVVGLVMLTITVCLSIYLQHFHWVFVSHMGAIKPAYYFYVFGCTFCAGLLIPSAAIFYMHNNNQILLVTTDEHARARLLHLNKASFLTAGFGAIFFALQSTFPMVDSTTGIHGIFASIFFSLILVHSIITSYLYYGLHLYCSHTPLHCLCHPRSQFWLKWKIVFSFLITFFTICTVFFIKVAYLLDPVKVSDVLYHAASPSSMLVVAGAVCEYVLVALMILYFCAYLYDLKSVVVTVVPQVSVDDENLLVNHRVTLPK